VNQLPSELSLLVEKTVVRARLRGGDRVRVREELECHFADGLDAGIAAEDLAREFGNPELAGRLIRRATSRRTRSGLRRAITVTLCPIAVMYGLAAARIQTAADSALVPMLMLRSRPVVETNAFAMSRLDAGAGLLDAYVAAADLRRMRNLWSETASLILLDRVVQAADSMDGYPAWIADSLRTLEATEGLVVRHVIVHGDLEMLIRALSDADGALGPASRRLIVHTKGSEYPGWWAALLEPIYFVRPLSRQQIARAVAEAHAMRLSEAEASSQRLLNRRGMTAS
jgi:hypothetical protein